MRTLLTRSVVRGYTDEPIEAPVVEALLDAMLAAPSGATPRHGHSSRSRTRGRSDGCVASRPE
ncbi:hypothetical protein NKH18_10650 [Streptomyces sp. M10(2022)]